MATIGLFIDLALILALAIFAFLGYRKGFLKSIISLFSWIVCIIIAILTAKYVAGWINGIYDFSNLIGDGISDALVKNNKFFGTALSAFGSKENLLSSIPSGSNKLLVQLIKVVFSHSNVDWTSSTSVADVVGANLGHVCMIVIAGILIFAVLMIVVKLLTKMFDRIASTKVLGTINRVLGLGLGIIKAAFFIIIINGALVGLTLIPAANKIITPLIQDNTHVERIVFNQTDKAVEKYLIKGDVIQTWVDNLWENRK